ncbi:MAG: hypothetical protein V7784_15300 [Oceanospirillaceae bacterium]
MEPISIKIEYWTYPDGTQTGVEPNGIVEFRSVLNENYASLVKGTSGECGGLYSLAIEIVSNIVFSDIANLIVGGVAYDTIKSGTSSFFIRPFLDALSKLVESNKDNSLDIENITFIFQDTKIYIYNLRGYPAIDYLKQIFSKLSMSYSKLIRPSGECPYEIHIPTLDDKECSFGRFRVPLDVDESIEKFENIDYLKYWGAVYNLEIGKRVFDVASQFLIDENFLTLDEYDREWLRNNP